MFVSPTVRPLQCQTCDLRIRLHSAINSHTPSETTQTSSVAHLFSLTEQLVGRSPLPIAILLRRESETALTHFLMEAGDFPGQRSII